jgi:cell division protein FtsX
VSRHGWREVRRQVRESGPIGLVAVLLVMVATAWGGVLWVLRDWTLVHLLAHDRATTVVAVLKAESSPQELNTSLAARFPALRPSVLTPRQVQEELARWFPELATTLLGLEPTTFPPLLQITAAPDNESTVLAWLRARPEVALVESSRAWQARLEKTTARVLAFGFALAFSMLTGCCAVVLLVIRLLVIEHADEIAIMRLIGAHENDIRMPYLLCGALLGMLGGALGGGLLLLGGIAIRALIPTIAIGPALVATLPASGAAAGVLGAVFGLASLPKEP